MSIGPISRSEFVRAFGCGLVGAALFPRTVYAQIPADSYQRIEAPSAPVFTELGLGNGSGLSFNSEFDVPGWAKLLTLGLVQRGNSVGTTKLHASNDSNLLLVLDALGSVAGLEERRVVILSFRRHQNDPSKVLFASKMVKHIDDALVASVAATPHDQQLDMLRSRLGAGEKVKGTKSDIDEILWVERIEPNRILLRTEEPKKGKPRGDQVVLERTGDGRLRIAFKSNVLCVKLP